MTLFVKTRCYKGLCLLLFACLAFDLAAVATASENQEAEAADASIDELVQSWKELDADLADMELEFNSATDATTQEQIKKSYTALVEQSEEVVGKIRTKALAALNSGNPDEKTSKLLVGLLMNDSEYERYNEAIKLGDQLIAGGIDTGLLEQAASADRLSIVSKELIEEIMLRQKQQAKDDLPQVKIVTSKGEMTFELFEEEAPNTVANFVSLIEKKFYDGLKFHRVVEGFVAQGGDPKGDGSGGPGYTIKCECSSPEARRHYVGSLSMAHAGEDTGGSQFFICLDRSSTAALDGRHTVFGRVTSGLDVLDNLARNYTSTAAIANAESDTITSMTIIRKRDHEYKPEVTKEDSDETDEADESDAADESTDENADGGEAENAEVTGDESSEEGGQ